MGACIVNLGNFMKCLILSMALGLLLVTVEAFHVGSSAGVCRLSKDPMTARNAKKKDRMELENIDGFEPKVDWDAEMKKLNERRGQPDERPADVEVEGPENLYRTLALTLSPPLSITLLGS